MNQILLFSSLKGGVGKTTAVSSLAAALAFCKRRVLCVDLDFGVRGLDLALGAENTCGEDVLEVIRSGLDVKKYATELEENLFFLPAPALFDTRAPASVGQEELNAFLALCKRQFDFTLLDLPAGGGELFLPLAGNPLLSGTIVLSTPEVTSVRAAEQTGYEIRAAGSDSIRLILNRYPVNDPDRPDLFRLAGSAGIPVLGVVPEEKTAPEALAAGVPLSRLMTGAGNAYRNIAARLCGQSVPILEGVLPPRKRKRLQKQK